MQFRSIACVWFSRDIREFYAFQTNSSLQMHNYLFGYKISIYLVAQIKISKP